MEQIQFCVHSVSIMLIVLWKYFELVFEQKLGFDILQVRQRNDDVIT